MSTTTRLMEKLLVFQERQAVALEEIARLLIMPPILAVPNQQGPSTGICPKCSFPNPGHEFGCPLLK